MIQEIKAILLRDLASVQKEVEAYPSEAALWVALPGLTNPGGNLALHLAGNLQFFIGAQLGQSGYVRDREAEFALKGVPRSRILQELEAAAQAVETTLSALDPAQLEQTFPVPFGGKPTGTLAVLLHLAGHLSYHLGQMNVHRRVSGR